MKKLRFTKVWIPPCVKFDLKMKLTSILLFLTLCTATAKSSYSQNITLKLNNVAIAEIIDKIEETTEYRFIYNTKFVNLQRKTSVNVADKGIKEVLTRLFKNTKTSFQVMGKQVVLKELLVSKTPKNKEEEHSQILEQTHEVNGTVKDASGELLPGASILEKGTTNGTDTDFDGNFNLIVSNANATLVVSFVGYETKEIPINGLSTINIVLEEGSNQLDEVVVTALGLERNKKSLSYAVSEVDGEKLANKAEVDVVRALNGKVAGVNISASGGAAGSSTNIVIRGNNSATGNNQPLFVVDGIPFDNSTTSTSDLAGASSTYSNRALDLDPNDIASMTVLKGGAAAALYGSRASNGVIIITTHNGSGARKGLEVELSNTFGFESIARLPDYQNKYGQGNYVNGRYTFSSSATESWGPAFDDPNLDGNGGLFVENGTAFYTSHFGEKVPYRAFPDNVKEFFRTGTQRETSIRAMGGNANSNFAITASNVDNEGFLPFTGLKRSSVKVTGQTKLQNGLKLAASVSYVNTHQDGILSGGHNTLSSINRQTLFIPRSYDLTGFPYIDEVTRGQLQFSFWDNPRWLAQEGPYDSDVDRVYGYVSANYKLTSWLNASYKIGYNTYTDRRVQVLPRGTFFTTGSIINNNISFGELESNFILTGVKQLTDDLNLRVVVGHNYNQRTTDNVNIRGTGIIKPGINRITNTEAIVADASAFTKRRIVGVYSDIVLSYKNYLFLNLTGRNDWSSTLPKGKRSFFYPSISTTFNFTDAFDLDSKALTFGKVRLAYTKIGNDASPYLLSTVNTINGSGSGVEFPFLGVSGTEIGDNLGNENLKPEFTTEFEFGLELNLFENLVGLDFAYYSKSTKDQIFSVNIPAATGYRTKTLNAGEITNKGIEIGLDINPIRSEDGLNWNIYGTFARNVSEVVSLINGLDQINPGNRTDLYGNILRVGQPYGVIEGEVQNRDSEGNLLVNPQNGLPTRAPELGIIGDPNPDFIVGISNTFSYKGFSFGFLFDWKQGGDIMSLSNGYLRGLGLAAETAVDRSRTYIIPGYLADPTDPTQPWIVNGEKVPNNIQISPQDYWSGATNGTQINQYRFSGEALIFDATVYRLRELSVGYTFSKDMLKKLPFGKASITLLGRNLWFKAPNLPHIDPEVSTYGAGNAQGVEQYAPPTTKNIAVNVKLSF